MWARAATLAALLVVAVTGSAAEATVPEGNLLQNPSAEDGPPGLPGWTVEGSLTAFPYDTPGEPGGAYFFAGGDGADPITRAYQTFDVAQAADEIDGCRVSATFAGNFGGRGSEEDRAGADVAFFDKDGGVLNVFQIGYPTAADRSNATGLFSYTQTQTVPAETRSIKFTVTAQRSGEGYNDGFADNLSLSLAEKEPSGGGGQAPAPVAGQTVVVRVTRGTATFRYHITIQLPGGPCSIPPELVQQLLDQIAVFLAAQPVIDARKGEVELKTASDQSGRFSRGVFELKQRAAATPLTELVMRGGSFAKTCKGRGARVSAARRRVVRQLFGRAHGRFRTRGRNSSATIRGTQWLVKETCAGTLTTSRRGTVVVRDLVKHRTRVLHSGESYLARAPR